MHVYIRLRGAGSEYEWQHGQVVRRVETDPTARMSVVQLADGRLVEANEEQDVVMANTHVDASGGAGDGGKLLQLAAVENLDALTHLHEASLVDYLKERYAIDQVYCRSGSVLIAVNPFKEIRGMYDMAAYNDQLEVVAQSGDQQRDDTQLPPHVFSMAESAYQSLRRRRRLVNEPKKNQTILVSGESGAGKTESTKFIMQYLAEVSSPPSSSSDSSFPMPDLTKFLLSANPILESFGNARTLRNDNSSRFGKFVRMYFNEPDATTAGQQQHMQMVRTTVETYLLERVRVVHQGFGERNFHIFYELLKGATPEIKQIVQLTNFEPKDFQYVNVGRCYARNDGVSDSHQFHRVLDAMAVIGFTQAEQEAIWKLLSALLHLGNIGFVPPSGHEDEDPSNAPPCIPSTSSASSCPSRDHLVIASQLLALDEQALTSGLTVRTINVSGETFQVNLSPTQCTDTRDATARSLYGWVFQYLVKRINDKSPDDSDGDKSETDTRPCIAVLDIFGFEEFDVNQFEQFCINYANEKLQYQFIKDILESEQDAHMQEGVTWHPVDYMDNTQCLEMIEQRPSGIFSLLDEECLMPKGSDASFARKMYLQMNKQSTFVASKKDQVDFAFQVSHYAGLVTYHATGFCEKNKDQPNAELLVLLKKSQDKDLKVLFQAFEENESPAATKPQQERVKIRRRASVIGAVGIGSQFKQQLANLLEVVQQTQTHYIRCIKPNDQNVRGVFDMAKVSKQLRYGGVLKAIEIMRQSFPVRMPHSDFVVRYTVLATASQPRRCGQQAKPKETVDVISLVKHFAMAAGSAEVGRTRVFLKQTAFDGLERDRDILLTQLARKIQSKWRGVAQRTRYTRVVEVLTSIQLRWRAIREKNKLMRARSNAAIRIQRQCRMWQLRRVRKRVDAVQRIQRLFKRWSLTKVVAAAMADVAGVEVSSSSSFSSRTTPPAAAAAAAHRIMDSPSFVGVKKREYGSSFSPSPSTEDSQSTVDDSDDYPWVVGPPAPMGVAPAASATGDDKELLRRALSELERLRLRATAAEAALAQLAGPSHQALSSYSPGSTMDPNQGPATASSSSFMALPLPLPARGMDPFGNTMLHRLVESGTPEQVYAFLESDPSSLKMLNTTENQRGFTPLHAAVRRGCVDVVGIFFRPDVLPHININATDRDGNTALHVAVQLNDELADRVMELLLCFGADPNATNYLKQTPLHMSTMVNRPGAVRVELMEKLLRYGGDPCHVDLLKRTALHYAVDKDMDDVAILLVKSGGDMNIPDAEGHRVVTHAKGTHLLRYLRTTPSWIPDTEILACMICQEPFTFFFGRKCHCDRCGRVCCAECCPSSSNWNGRFCFDCKHYQHVS